MANEKSLLVRHLPEELSLDDQEDLLRHFGAQQVHCFGKKGRMKHSAIATYEDHDAAKVAMARLHQLEVLGHKLVVEICRKQHIRYLPSDLPDKKPPVEKEVKEKEAETQFEISVNRKEISRHINSLAANWGLEYPVNPKLEYMYPPPSVSILTNVANALASVPKFYVQVLHLMNRLNLPAPFGAVTPTPPMPEMEPAPPLPEEPETAPEEMEVSSTEESELESDEDKEAPKKSGVKRPAKDPNRPRKKHKMQHIISVAKAAGSMPAQKPSDVFEQASSTANFRAKFKVVLPTITEMSSGQTNEQTFLPQNPVALEQTKGTVAATDVDSNTLDPTPGPEGFGKIEPVTKEGTENIENPDGEEEPWGKSEFISDRTLRRGRISSSQMRDYPVFRNYNPGEPTSRLYIKNLAKQVSEKDLHHIYGKYVDWNSETEKNMFDIRLMKEGRMKGQAFITLPNDKVAQEALKATNGYVLQNKPVVVQFARSAKPKEKESKNGKGKSKT